MNQKITITPPIPDVEGVDHRISLKIAQMLQQGRRYFGSAGASLSHHANNPDYDSEFKRKLTSSGLEGERSTSKKIREWMRDKPNAVLIDSVHIKGMGTETIDPESGTVDGGDTDHILLIGSLVILIDSKRWKSRKVYSVSDKGAVLRQVKKDGRAMSFGGSRVNAKAAKYLWKNYLHRSAKISSIVCVNAEKVFVKKDANWKKQSFKLLTLEDLLGHLDYIYKKLDEKDRTTINSTLVSQIAVCCIKPFDPYSRLGDKERLKNFK